MKVEEKFEVLSRDEDPKLSPPNSFPKQRVSPTISEKERTYRLAMVRRYEVL
jgi:hypothetical protein